ncbi:hypothetical protein, partial [Methylobacterium soli]
MQKRPTLFVKEHTGWCQFAGTSHANDKEWVPAERELHTIHGVHDDGAADAEFKGGSLQRTTARPRGFVDRAPCDLDVIQGDASAHPASVDDLSWEIANGRGPCWRIAN